MYSKSQGYISFVGVLSNKKRKNLSLEERELEGIQRSANHCVLNANATLSRNNFDKWKQK